MNTEANAENIGSIPRLLSADEVRRVDAAAARAGKGGGALMAEAGAAVARAALEMAGDGRVVVLAGPGDNGGDGYGAARLIREARPHAAGPRVLSLGDPERLTGDAAAAWRAWRAAGGAVEPMAAPDAAGADLVIDALFGVGLSRPLDGAAAAWALALGEPGAPPVLSVDLPSGVSADSGRALGPAFRAARTVTFVAPRRAHFLAQGAALSGALEVVDIGAPADATARALADSPEPVFEIAPALWRRALAKTDVAAHKYRYGHVVVASGGFGATGAARLAARAALRIGAGLVTVAAPAAAMAECAAQLTAEMLRRAESPSDLAALLADRRVNAVALGPGHAAHPGGAARARAFAAELLAGEAYRSGVRAAVLDADALTAWSDEPAALFAALAPGRAALTPHPGEFRALFPDLADALVAPPTGDGPGRVEIAREAARRSGAVVLLKGVDTAVAAPDGRVALHYAGRERAAPQLATAGSGDVLCGLIAGLAARGWPLFEAACAGVWVHVEAARRAGPGMIATDLAEAVRGVVDDA